MKLCRQSCAPSARIRHGTAGPILLLALQTGGAAELFTGTFQNPINRDADPWMQFFEGNYYLTTTQGDRIRMWKAPTLAELKRSQPVTIWQDSDPSRSRGIWAPEFHFISNRWYLYYTATSSDNKDDAHRMYVLESAGTDPLGPYTFKARLADPANDRYAIIGGAQPGSKSSIGMLMEHPTLERRAVWTPSWPSPRGPIAMQPAHQRLRSEFHVPITDAHPNLHSTVKNE